jgi:hypothetical protein
MNTTRVAFGLVMGVGALFAGAIVIAGEAAGCNRAGVIAESDASEVDGGCPACPPDPNRAVTTDCTQAGGIDTLRIETFNYLTVGNYLSAQDLYSYTDGTANLYFETFLHDVTYTIGFEPPVVGGDLCTPPQLGNGVLHMFGGPFLSWGGGIGVAMQKLNGRDPGNNGFNVDLAPMTDPAAPKGYCCSGAIPSTTSPCEKTTDPKFAATCPPADAEFAVYVGAIDVSQYVGVSFWARRGYTGQAGVRVNVGDKYTDDDLNYLAQRQQMDTGQPQPLHCKRARECACRNHQDCLPFIGATAFAPATGVPQNLENYGGFFCGTVVPPGNLSGGCIGLNGGPSLCCAATACDAPYPAYPNDLIADAGLVPGRPPPWGGNGGPGGAGDPQFYGRPCTPYAYENGVDSLFCYDPARDPPPALPTEQCGDHWISVVTLDTGWQFYKVPFTDLHQQGFAQKSEQLDLHSVSVVRFTWDVGYVDDWFDDVSFYR